MVVRAAVGDDTSGLKLAAARLKLPIETKSSPRLDDLADAPERDVAGCVQLDAIPDISDRAAQLCRLMSSRTCPRRPPPSRFTKSGRAVTLLLT